MGDSTSQAHHAYIVVVPDPNEITGIALNPKNQFEVTNWSRMFWLKIGDGQDIVKRVGDYKNVNPSQRLAIIKLKGSGDNGNKPLGKYLQKNIFKGHRVGGMLPGGSSEWRGVYGDESLAGMLVKLLDTFIQINEAPNAEALQTVNGLSWENIKGNLESVSGEKFKGPKDNLVSLPETYPMIAIVVTPNIAVDGLNYDFNVQGYVESGNSDTFTYWCKISHHTTQNSTAQNLLYSTSRSYVPDFGYSAYSFSAKELSYVDDMKQLINSRYNVENMQPLDKLVAIGQDFLKTELEKYRLKVKKRPTSPWLSISGKMDDPKAKAGIEFLRLLIEDFPKNGMPPWERILNSSSELIVSQNSSALKAQYDAQRRSAEPSRLTTDSNRAVMTWNSAYGYLNTSMKNMNMDK